MGPKDGAIPRKPPGQGRAWESEPLDRAAKEGPGRLPLRHRQSAQSPSLAALPLKPLRGRAPRTCSAAPGLPPGAAELLPSASALQKRLRAQRPPGQQFPRPTLAMKRHLPAMQSKTPVGCSEQGSGGLITHFPSARPIPASSQRSGSHPFPAALPGSGAPFARP